MVVRYLQETWLGLCSCHVHSIGQLPACMVEVEKKPESKVFNLGKESSCCKEARRVALKACIIRNVP